MDDPLHFFEEWKAVAREHDGFPVYYLHPELPKGEGLEPLILRVENEEEDLRSVHLCDIAGNERVMFLIFGSDLKELSGD